MEIPYGLWNPLKKGGAGVKKKKTKTKNKQTKKPKTHYEH